ncbi:peroxisomal ATPase PEX1-like [Physella acuta]|uniref:peroxisomal ATPase PEX1-like n=1 Tax=Physella acuta TaxID=109671 RepID=UPI0027DCEFBF|nr:peroxisomal ATPase PEX1-like [Physella acuta]
MNSSQTTVILNFGHEKHCFLRLVKSFDGQKNSRNSFSRNDEIVVYQADLSPKPNAYFSVYGNDSVLTSGDYVQINGWYGNKLGLRDEEPLPLKQLSKVLAAKMVEMVPLSPDDWEIIERNPRRIESVLLDQVRVVWTSQIFPIWIEKSVCIYMKITSTDPASACVLLENDTQINVSSKTRVLSPPQSLALNQTPTTQGLTPSSQAASQVRSRGDLLSASDYASIDTLEPRPALLSPGRESKKSSRNVRKNATTNPPDNPLAQRQISLMDMIKFLSFRKKEEYDNKSDSDTGSGIDYSMSNLPPRSSILRVQPLKRSCTLEECFPGMKPGIKTAIISGIKSTSRSNSKVFPINVEPKSDEEMKGRFPYELFQPSTIYVDAESTKSERLLHPYLPYLPRCFIARIQKLYSPNDKIELAKSRRTSSTGNNTEGQAGTTDGSSGTDASPGSVCYVRVVAIDRKMGLTDDAWQDAADRVLSEQPLLYGHAIVPDLLRRQLKLEATSSVWLQTGPVEMVTPRKVSIYPASTSLPSKMTTDLLKTFFIKYIKQCATEKVPLVVFQGIFLKYMVANDPLEVQLVFYGENDQYHPNGVAMLNEVNIDYVLLTVERDIKTDKAKVINRMLSYVQISDMDPKPHSVSLKQLGGKSHVINRMLSYVQISDMDPKPHSVSLKQLGGVRSIAEKALTHMHTCLGVRPLSQHTFMSRPGLSHGILLITGPKGSGKTTLVKALCRRVSHLPIMAHITMVDCKSFRGVSLSSIQKQLEQFFDEAAWREPSIIVFDNLDAITPAPSGPENEMNAEALYAARFAQIMQGLIKFEVENNSRLAVIATSKSSSSLHPTLVSSRGIHYVQQTLNIPSPDRIARMEILEAILHHHNSITIETTKTLDFQQLAAKMEGYVARDVESLVNMAIHAKLTRETETANSKLTLTQEDFDAALLTFKPASTRNVKLHKPGELGWDDVGGLKNVKTALVETLKWPTKYPALFNSCPLRLRSGILLYGAPGTGKTLLAGVVAKECGLNFISIKGPELLSKYIGASEQAVRDLFIRAQSVKPCILFFDEFDSIAPKRGHDSTGVTDRVVNQLLTQLDGVEGLQGIYVLGATSRPDLIDPALLRPGRLDKSMSCDLPNKDDRYEILVALTRKMSLADNVNLQEIAEISEFFTGADLKALLYNAQLKSIHEQTEAARCMKDGVFRIQGDATKCIAFRRPSLVGYENFTSKLHISSSKSASLNTSVDESMPSNESSNKNSPISPKFQKLDSGDRFSKTLAGKVVKGESFAHPNAVPILDEEEIETQDQPETVGQVEKNLKYIDDIESPTVASESLSDTSLAASTSQSQSLEAPAPPSGDAVADGNKKPLSQNELDDVVKKLTNVVESRNAPQEIHWPHKEKALAALAALQRQTEAANAEAPMARSRSFVSEAESRPSSASRLVKTSSLDIENRTGSPEHSGQKGKRKRQAPQTSDDPFHLSVKLAPGSQNLKSPSQEKPVTVFNLEQGLATLSADDQAKYLAMVKKIQQRDEYLFQSANDRRRTSLQMASRPAVLLEVNQRHLLEAIVAMRPSVSPQERQKYLDIYESFVSSRTGKYEKPKPAPVGSRATLA